MIVTSMQLKTSSWRDIAVLQKESSPLEGGEGVNVMGFSTLGLGGAPGMFRAAVASVNRRAFLQVTFDHYLITHLGV